MLTSTKEPRQVYGHTCGTAVNIMYNCTFDFHNTIEKFLFLKDKWTALHWAAFNGHKSAILALVAAGANVDSQTEVL